MEDIFLFQLTNGCEKIVCNNPNCANCPKFALSNASYFQKQQIAFKMAQNHESKKSLCHYINILLCNEEARKILQDFENFANSFTILTPPSEILQNINPVFTNFMYFCQLFTPKDKFITKTNLLINDQQFFKFSTILSSIPILNTQIYNLISSIAIDIMNWKNSITISIIRGLLIIFYFPSIFSPKSSESMLLSIFIFIKTKLEHQDRKLFISELSKCPNLTKQIIGIVHCAISDFYANREKPDPYSQQVIYMLEVMNLAFLANERSNSPLPTSIFYNHHINDSFTLENQFNGHSNLLIEKFSFVLNLNTKIQICSIQTDTIRAAIFYNDIINNNNVRPNIFLDLLIRRNHIVEDTLNCLSTVPYTDWLKKLRVMFEGEEAVDLGGPSREFIHLICQTLFSSDYGMFGLYGNHYLWFTPLASSIEDDHLFTLYGLIIGLAIYNEILLPVHFPRAFFKSILNISNFTLNDLEQIEPDVAKSLRELLLMPENGENVGDLCLTFSSVIDIFGHLETVDFIKNGSTIDVNNENVDQYVEQYIKFKFIKSIQFPMNHLRKGFCLVCKAGMYQKLTPDELDLCMSGEEIIDWDFIKRNTEYVGYNKEEVTIIRFWEIYDKMVEDDKRKLLKFITGTDRIPPSGMMFKMKLLIKKCDDIQRLPSALTCISQLLLPPYPSKEIMERKLYYAMQYFEGFGFK